MEKRGLGKGIAALISDTHAESDSAVVRSIELSRIRRNPKQPRTYFDPESAAELAASVKELGVLQPILVRRTGHDSYEIVAGERRYRAAQAAGLSTIPALVKLVDDRLQLELAIVENVQREDIGVVEEAHAYRRLIDEFGLTQDEVAQRVGKSRPAIANVVRLLALPDPVLQSVATGELTEGHARALLAVQDSELMLEIWREVNRKGLTVRATEALVRAKRTSKSPEVEPNSAANHYESANERDVVDRMRQRLGTNVAIRRTASGGRIEIEFYSDEELLRVVDILLERRGANGDAR